MSEILQKLDVLLQQRLKEDPDSSYVASLHHRGLNKVLEKIGEEATEVIIAAKDNDKVVSETADLWFHCMVMLAQLGYDSSSVLNELEQRFGTSGLDEKASRTSPNKSKPINTTE